MQQETQIQSRDKGTPELADRQLLETVGKTTYNRSGLPVDYYLHRRLIRLHHWEAAEKFYFYWYYGSERAKYVTARDPREPKGKCDPESGEHLEGQYNKAMHAIRRVVPRLVVFNVVCIGEWLCDIDKATVLNALENPSHYLKQAFGKNKRMELLIEGLEDLAKHFKIPAYNDLQEEEARQKEPAI